MKSLHVGLLLASGTLLYAGYQPTFSDGLTLIDSARWSQNGSLSASSHGVTGNGSLISLVPVSTGSDYEVSMTIHTSTPGICTGTYSLYTRSTPDANTAYVLTLRNESVGLFRERAGDWTLLSSMPYHCEDGTVMRLVARGGSLTFWSGPNMATYVDPAPIPSGHPGVGLSSNGDTITNVRVGPIDYLPPAAVNVSAVQTSVTPNQVDMRWPATAADANSVGLQGYVVYRDGVYLGSSRTPEWLDQTVVGRRRRPIRYTRPTSTEGFQRRRR